MGIRTPDLFHAMEALCQLSYWPVNQVDCSGFVVAQQVGEEYPKSMTIAIILHVIGTVLGVGAVTMNDIALLRAIGDGDLGVAYQKSTRLYSLVVWVGLALLLATGAYFALTQSWVLQSEKILVKLFLVAILTINGVMIARFLTPLLGGLTREDWAKRSDKLRLVLRAGVFPGALSAVTWYTTLILGAAGRQEWTAQQMIGWYVVALVVAWAAAHWIVKQRLMA